MSEYRVETVLTEDRTLMLEDLPFRAGDAVEVTIVERAAQARKTGRYPLRGQPIRYDRPTDPVAAEDWHAMQ